MTVSSTARADPSWEGTASISRIQLARKENRAPPYAAAHFAIYVSMKNQEICARYSEPKKKKLKKKRKQARRAIVEKSQAVLKTARAAAGDVCMCPGQLDSEEVGRHPLPF